MGKVRFSVCSLRGECRLPQLHPIILSLISCPFWWGTPSPFHNTSTGPMAFLGGTLVLAGGGGEELPHHPGVPPLAKSGWGTPWPGQDGQTPLAKSRWGTPLARSGWGTPLARSGWATPWPSQDGVPPSQDWGTPWPGQDWYPSGQDWGSPRPPEQVTLGQVMPRAVPLLRFPAGLLII